MIAFQWPGDNTGYMLTLIQMHMCIVVELLFLSRITSSEKCSWKTACCVSFGRRNFEKVDIDNEIYLYPFTVTEEIRLTVSQWKIIHTIYPTQTLCSKKEKLANSNCRYVSEKRFLWAFCLHMPGCKAGCQWYWTQKPQYLWLKDCLGYFPQISLNRLSKHNTT